MDGVRNADEAKQKPLALILAIRNDSDGFDDRIAVPLKQDARPNSPA